MKILSRRPRSHAETHVGANCAEEIRRQRGSTLSQPALQARLDLRARPLTRLGGRDESPARTREGGKAQRSITTSPIGRAQQISRLPSAGASSGSGR
jgi:hypothetical protein